MATETPQTKRLRAVAAQMPQLDAAAQRAAQQGAAIQYGQAVGQLAAQPGAGVRSAQAAAPVAVAQAGELARAGAATAAQNQLAVADVGAQIQGREQQASQQQQALGLREAEQARDIEAQSIENTAQRAQKTQLQGAELAQAERLQRSGLDYDERLSFLTRQQRSDLGKLGRGVRKELFDDRLAFEHDELGRKFANTRQLADYAVLSAKSDEEARGKMQSMAQAYERKSQLFNRAYELATIKFDQALQQAEQRKDQASKAKILEAKRELERQKAEHAAKAANTALWAQGGSLVGAVAGGMLGGPVGAAAGSAAGGALGGKIGEEVA